MSLRIVVAEAIGTAFLVMAVVGSGIMAESLAGGNVAIALLANTLATSFALLALILTLGPISGAHLNPAVSLTEALRGSLSWFDALRLSIAQTGGALAGVAIAHLMFEKPVYSFSQHARAGLPQMLGEVVATFGLLAVIRGASRGQASYVAFAVAAYIGAAYWFTSSTSFANPAVTVARCLTDTFSGIRPSDVPGFLIAQAIGALIATALFRGIERDGASK